MTNKLPQIKMTDLTKVCSYNCTSKIMFTQVRKYTIGTECENYNLNLRHLVTLIRLIRSIYCLIRFSALNFYLFNFHSMPIYIIKAYCDDMTNNASSSSFPAKSLPDAEL